MKCTRSILLGRKRFRLPTTDPSGCKGPFSEEGKAGSQEKRKSKKRKKDRKKESAVGAQERTLKTLLDAKLESSLSCAGDAVGRRKQAAG